MRINKQSARKWIPQGYFLSLGEDGALIDNTNIGNKQKGKKNGVACGCGRQGRGQEQRAKAEEHWSTSSSLQWTSSNNDRCGSYKPENEIYEGWLNETDTLDRSIVCTYTQKSRKRAMPMMCYRSNKSEFNPPYITIRLFRIFYSCFLTQVGKTQHKTPDRKLSSVLPRRSNTLTYSHMPLSFFFLHYFSAHGNLF